MICFQNTRLRSGSSRPRTSTWAGQVRQPAMAPSKWGGIASFVLAVAWIIPALIYLMGDLRATLGPLAYGVADFLYGPVWTVCFNHGVLGAPGADWQCRVTANVFGNIDHLARSGGDGLCSLYPLGQSAISFGSPRIALGGFHDGSGRLDYDHIWIDRCRMAFSGVVFRSPGVGGMDDAPPATGNECAVPGHWCHSLVGVCKARS